MFGKIYDIVKVMIERMVDIIMPGRIESTSDTFLPAEPVEVYLATDPSGKQYNLIQAPDWSGICILDTESRIAINIEKAISNGFKIYGHEGPMSSCYSKEYDTDEGHIRENGTNFENGNGYSRETAVDYEIEKAGKDGTHAREINSEHEKTLLTKDGYARTFSNNYEFEKLDKEGFFTERGSGFEMETFDKNGYQKEVGSEYQNQTFNKDGFITEKGFFTEVEIANKAGHKKANVSAFKAVTFGKDSLIFQNGFEYELETINKDGRVRENVSAYEITKFEAEVQVERGFTYNFQLENTRGNMTACYSNYEYETGDFSKKEFNFSVDFVADNGLQQNMCAYGLIEEDSEHIAYKFEYANRVEDEFGMAYETYELSNEGVLGSYEMQGILMNEGNAILADFGKKFIQETQMYASSIK